MKHIKAYEKLYINNTLDYDVDDYVLIRYDKDSDTDLVDVNDVINKNGNLAKIVETDKDDMIQPYYVRFPSNFKCWLHEDEIERELTYEEIEEYKMREKVHKYNL